MKKQISYSIDALVKLFAFVFVVSSLFALYLSLSSQYFKFLLLIALVCSFLVTALIVFITRSILKPIAAIRDGMKKVMEGDLTTRMELPSASELKELARILNFTIGKIQKETFASKEAQTTLEIKVRARTKELEELAESLGEKVAARTKELEEKVRELERFQKIAVGRELRMIELKNKLQTLEKKAE